MIKKLLSILLYLIFIISFLSFSSKAMAAEKEIKMAVEFMDHAASAYIAKNKGWFREEGLKITAYESYITGMALAAALGRGDIDVAYICLVPAINVYANAKVPIKVVAGTHKYGYGLLVNPNTVKTVRDLEKPDIRIGCVREGGAVDVILHRIIDSYHLNESKILSKVQRMNPPKQILAVKTGQLDAAFLPEHHATMAEESGFKMILKTQDIWPEMQGSVLVVKESLLKEYPQMVKALVEASQKATDWINHHPDEAAKIVANELQVVGENIFPLNLSKIIARLRINPEVIGRSMNRLEYTTDITPRVVQDTIDYIAGLGYIKKSFKAEEILDLRFLRSE